MNYFKNSYCIKSKLVWYLNCFKFFPMCSVLNTNDKYHVFIIHCDMEPIKRIQITSSFIMFIFSLFISNRWLMTTMSEVNNAAYNTTRCNLVITGVFLRNMFREFSRRFYSFCVSFTLFSCGTKSVARCLLN